MKRNLMAMILALFLLGTSLAGAEGLLPSLTDTIGKPMPSLGEALGRYPDEEIASTDGDNTEVFKGVTETDFTTFSVYLSEKGATLADYQAAGTTFSASIVVDGKTITFTYDTQALEARVTYPKGTYDEKLECVKQEYQHAVSLYEEGKYEKARLILLPIKGYREAGELLSKDEHFATIRKEKISTFKKVGGIVLFGSYEQDDNIENGKEPIEWIVLEAKGNKVLLISKLLLESIPYNNSEDSVTWKTCSIRKWLNNDFYNDAFNDEEKQGVLSTIVDNSPSQFPKWSNEGGENTEDKVFLLSYIEAKKYLGVTDDDDSSAPKAVAENTTYSMRKWAANNPQKGPKSWWLRMPGGAIGLVGNVGSDGVLHVYKNNSTSPYARPCIWIDLDSDYFLW